MPPTTVLTDVVMSNDADDDTETSPVTFAELGVPGLLAKALAQDNKKTAFPIQQDTLPDSLAGRDILGRGRTGSGKTLAFSIPMITRLAADDFDISMTASQIRHQLRDVRSRYRDERRQDDFVPHPRGLVLAPTRELANQINDVLAPLAAIYGIATTTVYGGVKYQHQINDLRAGADIVVACPGRLEDLLEQGALTLDGVRVVVIDEADEMADMGFIEPIQRILRQIPQDSQHMLFSATLDHGVDRVVKEFLQDPKEHAVDEVTSAVDLMTHHIFEIRRSDKPELIRKLASGTGRRILFTRTKYQAKKLAKELTQHGIPAAELDGNLSQNQRDRNLMAFESGEVNVLVATDVAARGIDVSDVALVIQVDPPQDEKSFLHRSGRTARAGKAGDVVTIMTPDQRRYVKHLVKQAGIPWKPVKVTPDDVLVVSLVGEQAEPVMGWKLDTTRPLHGNHSGRGERSHDRKHRSRGRRDRGSDERAARPSRSRNAKKNAQRSNNAERDSWNDDGNVHKTVKNGERRGRGIHRDDIVVREDLRSESAKRHEHRMNARINGSGRDVRNDRNGHVDAYRDRRRHDKSRDGHENRRKRENDRNSSRNNGARRNAKIGRQSRAHMRRNSTPFSGSRKRH